MVVGTTHQEQKRVAQMFNCKIGTFPITYLGIPVSNKMIRAGELDGVRQKIRKRLAM